MMRSIIEFVKTTVIGGLLVIVPLGFVLFVLVQAWRGLRKIADTIAQGMGLATDHAWVALVAAGLVLLGLCFLTGLLVRTQVGNRLKRWINGSLAPRIPLVRGLSNLTRAFVGVENQHFVPVEIDLYGTGVLAIGFLVETLSGGRCAVFLPTSPVATAGTVLIVPESRISRLHAGVGETIGVVTQWGIDAAKLYQGPAADRDTPGPAN